MCVEVGQGTSVALIENDQPVKQVLVLGQLVFSYERAQGVLVGTHAEVSQRTAQRAVSRLEALAAEWQVS